MTNTKISKAGLSREQWLDLRRTGVGGSDVGAIIKESQCNDFNNTGASYSVSYIMSGIH